MRSTFAGLIAGLLLASVSRSEALTLTPGSAWPDPEIEVCWEAPRPEHRKERAMVRHVVAATWERESAVRFVGWRACLPGQGGVRLSIESGHPVAKRRGVALDGLERGVRLPALWSVASLAVNLKAPVHEFGHVLGFGHEYARPDLPDPERCGLTRRDGMPYLEADEALTPYDADSVMVGCVRGTNAAFGRGAPRLSAADIFGLVSVYGSAQRNRLDHDEAGDRFGASLMLRDLDGDGTADLVVGAPGEDAGRGAVYLYRGDALSGFRPWTRLDGPAPAARGAMARGFGADLAWRNGRLVVRATGPAGLTDFAFAPDGEEAPRALGPVNAERIDAPARLHAIPAEATAPGWARPELRSAIIEADLDGDGVAERILGLPYGDGDVAGSGVVVVRRGVEGGPPVEWYRFGQSY